jgi:putative ABC transport system ATP-binding protein
MSPGPLPIVVEHVNHVYGQGEAGHQVLFDITLSVLPGEITIVTGPSGSGKTTLLTLLGGLRSVQQGSVRVFGRELRGLDAVGLVAVRRQIGFIFQRHNLLEALTAYQNVKMAIDLDLLAPAQGHERIVELLTELGLADRMGYRPAKLSGGQRRRVAIARALALRPPLILADEPTAALGAEASRAVVGILQKLAKGPGRCASVIVTHDSRILDVADRIINLADGRIKSNVVVTESVLGALFLSKCPAFAGLTPDALAQMADKMGYERHPAGTVIIRQGDRGGQFYLIRRGSVNVVLDQGTPAQRTVDRLSVGDFFGERALVANEPRYATVVAREDVEAYTLDKQHFQEVLEASASLKEQLLKAYFQRQ